MIAPVTPFQVANAEKRCEVPPSFLYQFITPMPIPVAAHPGVSMPQGSVSNFFSVVLFHEVEQRVLDRMQSAQTFPSGLLVLP